MGCNIRTTVPIIPKELSPHLPDHSKLQKKERELRKRERDWRRTHFVSHHKARSLKPLDLGVCVRLPDMSTEGKAITETAPNSYVMRHWEACFDGIGVTSSQCPPKGSEEESTHKSKETSEDSIDPTQSPLSSHLDLNVTWTRSGRFSVSVSLAHTSLATCIVHKQHLKSRHNSSHTVQNECSQSHKPTFLHIHVWLKSARVK